MYVCVSYLLVQTSEGREKCRKCYVHTQSISKQWMLDIGFFHSALLSIGILATRVVLQLNYEIFRGMMVVVIFI